MELYLHPSIHLRGWGTAALLVLRPLLLLGAKCGQCRPRPVRALHEGTEIVLVKASSQTRLCGLVVRVLGYRSGGPGSTSGTNRKKSSVSETGSTQPREYNWGAT
jgi:hypothetical protein